MTFRTRRPFKEEIDRLYQEAPRKYDLARSFDETGIGGGEDWLSIAYLLEEIEHLETVLRDQCEATRQPFHELLGRRSMAEMGEVALELTLNKYPTTI